MKARLAQSLLQHTKPLVNSHISFFDLVKAWQHTYYINRNKAEDYLYYHILIYNDQ